MNTNITETETLAYIAGIFDGEGYVGTTPRFGIRVQIAMTHYETVAFIARLFDKNLTEQIRTTANKPLYCFTLSGIEAVEFLRLVRPWLRVKASQADVAFHLAELRKQNHHAGTLPVLNKKEQEECANLLKSLKKEEHSFELPPVESLERPDRHGTRFGYQKGCRCAECRLANADHAKAMRRKNKPVSLPIKIKVK